MHPSAAFHAGADRALELARRHPFATLAIAGGSGVETVQTPLIPVFGRNGDVCAFEGHLARANRVYDALADAGGEAVATAVFCGPDAYISPSWYASKPQGRVVPTWNYVSVEASGRARLIETVEETFAILQRQTAHFEAGEPEPWALEDGDPAYMDRLVTAIAGIRLEIDRFEATEKLSQNKADRDRAGVMAGLSRRDDDKSRALAAHMIELEKR
jgi:transcriptional regulator